MTTKPSAWVLEYHRAIEAMLLLSEGADLDARRHLQSMFKARLEGIATKHQVPSMIIIMDYSAWVKSNEVAA